MAYTNSSKSTTTNNSSTSIPKVGNYTRNHEPRTLHFGLTSKQQDALYHVTKTGVEEIDEQLCFFYGLSAASVVSVNSYYENGKHIADVFTFTDKKENERTISFPVNSTENEMFPAINTTCQVCWERINIQDYNADAKYDSFEEDAKLVAKGENPIGYSYKFKLDGELKTSEPKFYKDLSHLQEDIKLSAYKNFKKAMLQLLKLDFEESAMSNKSSKYKNNNRAFGGSTAFSLGASLKEQGVDLNDATEDEDYEAEPLSNTTPAVVEEKEVVTEAPKEEPKEEKPTAKKDAKNKKK